MSGSVGTMRASSSRHTGTKDKMTKGERNTSSQHQPQSVVKTEQQLNKMHPTQEQLRLAQLMTTNQSVADESTVKELMELTGKSEHAVVIALHDAENDADRAAMILMEGGDEPQGVWREQACKRKRKVNTSQKEGSDQIGEESESRNKNKVEREEKEKEGGSERQDMPPRRGRRSGGPPPRLARGRGRDRDNKEHNRIEDWDNDRGDDKRDRSGGDRGRSCGRGGYGVRRSGGFGGGRGRFNNSDKDGRNYNRVPRFERMNNLPPQDGPEIDTWTNETAETNTSKDTDWDNWNDIWVNEEDQWTGSLEETKVFTPSQMKVPDPVIAEPSSRGQRVDVGSLFIESAKFPKAPDYSKPSGDAYINHFNQAATESIKNSIGIGSTSRPPQPLSSLDMQQQSISNSLGLSSLSQNSGHVQIGVLSSLPQGHHSVTQTLTQLSEISMGSQESALGGIGTQVSRDQTLSVQSRIPSVIQQQQQNISIPTSMSNIMQQRPKPQKSKLPPPSKIPASAVEMPGHIPRNPQLDLQFGIDNSADTGSSFDFGADSDSVITVTSTYSTTNGTSTVITNHLGQPGHVNIPSDGSLVMPNILPTTSVMESQHSNRSPVVFHSSVYTSSPPQNEAQTHDREQSKMSVPEPISYSSQLELKAGTLMSQLTSQTNQNLSSGSLPQNKNETSYSSANGYTSSSYQSHQKAPSISQTQSYTHTTSSQPSQGSAFQGQYPASQSVYPSAGQSQFSNTSNASQFAVSGQHPTYSQNQYSSGQNQFASSGSNHPPLQHINHQSQYSSGTQNNYTSGGQSQYSGYQNSSSFNSHASSQANYSSSLTGGVSASMYPVPTQANSSFNSQTNSYQPPTSGSYHPRDTQTVVTVTTQSNTGVTFPSVSQSSLKPATSQTNTNYNSQSFSAPQSTLQPSPLTAKLGESLAKITIKDTTSLDGHQTSQYDLSSTSVTTVSSSLNLPSATSTALLSTGTTTTSSTSTAASITSPSRIASVPSTNKAPPNLPPGVPLMGQYIMGQSTMPPFYSVQPPLYGYEDVQLLQQRMPMTGSYYDMGAFQTPTGTTLTAGRDQQTLPGVPFSGSYAPFLPLNTGTSADASKMTRLDAQSPNSASQPQNAHSASQQPMFNVYGYYYPSVYPGGGLQYPMFPIPPVTNAAAIAGTTIANSQFPKNYTSHVYTTKGYDELNQAQDFSKTGYGSAPTGGGKTSGTRTTTSELTQNAYKSHTQAYDKQGFHGGTPPPFNMPLVSATQAGPMGAPTTPYATAPYLPVMAAHQLHHPIQQESNSSSSRGLNQAGNQTKTGAAKSYGGQYWNN